MRAHKQTVKRTGQGGRIVPFGLPTKSSLLNPIEPKRTQDQQAVSDPKRLLSAAELEDHLVMPKKVV
jgi:hypothetical protein